MELDISFHPVSAKSNGYHLPSGEVRMRTASAKTEAVQLDVTSRDGKSVSVFIDKADLREAAKRLG